MHVKIVNTKTGTESWERVYVSPEIKISLLSKYCLIRLKVIDPDQFLKKSEVRSFSVNTVDEKKNKLSDCEKSFYTQKDGAIGCKRDRRTTPPEFKRSAWEKVFARLKEADGDIHENMNIYLKQRFKASSMNICQTQPLAMMNVPKMTVEFKNESMKVKPKCTTQVIPIPLPLREQTKKTLKVR